MKDKKFEELMTELEEIVKELETGDVDLEKSIEKYTEAMKLANLCGEKLNNAVKSVNKVLNENGKLEDFKLEES